MKKELLLGLALFMIINNVFAQKIEHVLGEILVKPLAEKNIDEIVSKHSFLGEIPTGLQTKEHVSRNLDIWLLEFDYATIDENRFLEELVNSSLVHTAQFNHLVESRAHTTHTNYFEALLATIPNDPFLGNQWHWINGNDADVDAELAWDITTGGLTTQGDEIVVAVLDDGTQINHPDLAANHWVNTAEIPNNNVDDDGNGYVDDYDGWNIISDNDNVSGGNHGVNVNGMIGAVGNDGNQGTGINWKVKIMTVKNNFDTNQARVLEAYDYPLTMRKRYNSSGGSQGAYVVATNASWGIDFGNPASAPLWCQMYDTLGFYGVLNCGATSNSNINIDTNGDLPTACPSDYMISVTRTGNNDNQAGGYGVMTIDLGAPGINVYTAAAGSNYTTTTGTSFASPLTAGVIALMYSVPCNDLINLSKSDPEAAALEVRMHLLNGVDPVLPGIVATGGRVNAFNSCQLILDNCGSSSCASILNLTGNVNGTTTTENASMQINSNQVIDGSSNITYEAGNCIVLNPPFTVQDNGRFLAHIVSCFTTSDNPSSLVDNSNEQVKIVRQLPLSPQREKSVTKLSFNLHKTTDIVIVITDAFGNIAKKYAVEPFTKGMHHKDIDIQGLPEDGDYLLSVLTME